NLRLFLLRKVRTKTIELTRPAPVSIPASTCKSGATAPRRKFRDNFVRLTSPCASCRSRAKGTYVLRPQGTYVMRPDEFSSHQRGCTCQIRVSRPYLLEPPAKPSAVSSAHCVELRT